MPKPSTSQVFGIQPPDEETRRRALEAEGPSWREFVFFDLAKVWIVLGLFILDSWIAVACTEAGLYLALVPALAPAVLAEYLLYRYLWFRPGPDDEPRPAEFRPTLRRPVRIGRWTPEAWAIRAGEDPFAGTPSGPDPKEFL